jgi:hypothetical protein
MKTFIAILVILLFAVPVFAAPTSQPTTRPEFHPSTQAEAANINYLTFENKNLLVEMKKWPKDTKDAFEATRTFLACFDKYFEPNLRGVEGDESFITTAYIMLGENYKKTFPTAKTFFNNTLASNRNGTDYYSRKVVINKCKVVTFQKIGSCYMFVFICKHHGNIYYNQETLLIRKGNFDQWIIEDYALQLLHDKTPY